jgi:hypothetical protein
VTLNDKRLTLTPKEYRLLQVLAQHAGNVVTHQHLLKEVWGSIHVHDTHYLRIFVRKLRQKIEPKADSPKILVTELGSAIASLIPAMARTVLPQPPRPRPSPEGRLAGGRGRVSVKPAEGPGRPDFLTFRSFPLHNPAIAGLRVRMLF